MPTRICFLLVQGLTHWPRQYFLIFCSRSCVSPIKPNISHKEPLSTLLPGNQVDSDVIIQDSCSFDIYTNTPRKDKLMTNMSTRSVENSCVFNAVTSSSQMTQFPGYIASSSDMNRYMEAKNLKAALLNELVSAYFSNWFSDECFFLWFTKLIEYLDVLSTRMANVLSLEIAKWKQFFHREYG